MGRTSGLGEFEQAVLLAILLLRGNAYGVLIRRHLTERLEREVSFGAVYATLERLETKGYLSSWIGGATAERGGRSKRYYKIEAPGQRALRDAKNRAAALWGALPEGAAS